MFVSQSKGHWFIELIQHALNQFALFTNHPDPTKGNKRSPNVIKCIQISLFYTYKIMIWTDMERLDCLIMCTFFSSYTRVILLCTNVIRYVQNAFRYEHNVFRYVHNVFRYAQNIFRYMHKVFRYVQNVFRYVH